MRSSFPRRLGCVAAKTSAPLRPLGYRRNGRAIWPVEGRALGVTAFNVTNDTDDVDRSSYTTASVTILAQCAYLLSVITSHATAAPIPTIAGAGQTWVQVDSQTFAGGQGRLTTFRCGGLAGSGALTITATAATGCQWILDGFTGAITDNNGGGAIWQETGNNGTATTATVTLGTTESSSNASYGVWARSAAANEAWTPGTGFTSLVQTGGATPARSFLTEFSATLDTTIDASWTTSATFRAFGFEIRFLDPSKVYATRLTSGEITVTAQTATTATIAPDANRLILCAVHQQHASSVSPSTPTVTGCGVTWVQVATLLYVTTGVTRWRITLFRAMGTPTSGALTIDAGQTSNIFEWGVEEYGNVDLSGTNGSGALVQNATASGTTSPGSVTLAAFGNTSNGTYGTFGMPFVSATTLTAGSGFVIEETVNTARGMFLTEFQGANDASVDASWNTVTTGWGAVAAEIKYAPQPKPVVPLVPREALRRASVW